MEDLSRYEEVLRTRLAEAAAAQARAAEDDCLRAAATVAVRIVEALRTGGKVVFFGNGGSSCDAQHLAAELLGRFYIDRTALPAMSLADNTAAMTAIANDYSYADVFARQLRGLCVPGDVAVGLSTSGNSENVLRALQVARELGVTAVAMTGASGGKMRDVADILVAVPTEDTPRVQELCMHLGHTICEIVERDLFPDP